MAKHGNFGDCVVMILESEVMVRRFMVVETLGEAPVGGELVMNAIKPMFWMFVNCQSKVIRELTCSFFL
jgi:hypothetical protein